MMILPSPLRGGSTRNARRGGGGEDLLSLDDFPSRPPPLTPPRKGEGKRKHREKAIHFLRANPSL
jgi:hypothetical protein